jgi:hypothetical protein
LRHFIPFALIMVLDYATIHIPSVRLYRFWRTFYKCPFCLWAGRLLKQHAKTRLWLICSKLCFLIEKVVTDIFELDLVWTRWTGRPDGHL